MSHTTSTQTSSPCSTAAIDAQHHTKHQTHVASLAVALRLMIAVPVPDAVCTRTRTRAGYPLGTLETSVPTLVSYEYRCGLRVLPDWYFSYDTRYSSIHGVGYEHVLCRCALWTGSTIHKYNRWWKQSVRPLKRRRRRISAVSPGNTEPFLSFMLFRFCRARKSFGKSSRLIRKSFHNRVSVRSERCSSCAGTDAPRRVRSLQVLRTTNCC